MGTNESGIGTGATGSDSGQGAVDGERVDGSGEGLAQGGIGDFDGRSGSTQDRTVTGETSSNRAGSTVNRKREVKEESGGEAKRVRKPRTKAGSGSGSSAGTVKEKIAISVTEENVTRLAQRIAGFHDLADIALKTTPLLHLEDNQAHELSKAILRVLEQYDLSADPKYMALGNLMIVSAMIYQPKVALYREVQARRAAVVNAANESTN